MVLFEIVFEGIGGLVCIPITVWLMHTAPGEATLDKGALAVGDLFNGTLGEDDLDKGALAVVGDLDRLFPCWVLFLVRRLNCLGFYQ